MQLNEELLKKVGVTEITYENDPNYVRYDGRTCITNEPTFKLSLELDNRKLEDFQKAIEKLDKKTDEMELKNELLTMHNVNACPGLNISERIDNYLNNDDYICENNNDDYICENPWSVNRIENEKYHIKHR